MDIKKGYKIAAPADRVFAAWISDSYLVAPVTGVEVEPHVGGSFRLHTGDGDSAAVMNGRFEKFDAPQHLRYTWHWGGPDEPSIVDVQFMSVDGQTEIELQHTGLATESMVTDHENGWDSYINGLRELLN